MPAQGGDEVFPCDAGSRFRVFPHDRLKGELRPKATFKLTHCQTKQFLDKLERMFHICSYAAALKEKTECRVPSKPLRLPPLASDRSARSLRRA